MKRYLIFAGNYQTNDVGGWDNLINEHDTKEEVLKEIHTNNKLLSYEWCHVVDTHTKTKINLN